MRKLAIALIVLALGLAACSQAPVPATPSPTVIPPTATPFPAATLTPTLLPTATSTPTSVPTVIASTIKTARAISLPPGFAIGVYAQGLNGPRMMAIGPDGALYVADRGANRVVRLVDANHDGQADGIQVVASGRDQPSSLAFDPRDGLLFVSESTRVWRLSNPDAQGVYQDRQVIIDNLPAGGEHTTRTLLFSPDGASLYVSIGSTCNVCIESDNRRATIMKFNADGSGGQIYASGLRNAVGLAIRPGTDEVWATNNGRDYLGDTLPPETVYQVVQGQNYGWPRCYAGSIIDPNYGSADSCNGVPTPAVEMQAHMAPLGLDFYTGSQFPADYQGSLFIALHGSWNSTVPVGYKVMRVPVNGGQLGQAEDFATGWLAADGTVWGRPVDVVTAPDGSLFVSDDSAGVIYRIYYQGQ
jgi:glucose/arabinose dehydrogenase